MLAPTMRLSVRITTLLACAALVLAGCSSVADDYLHGLEDVCQATVGYVDAAEAGDTAATEDLAVAAVDAIIGWAELDVPANLSPTTLALDDAFRADGFETRLVTDPRATFDACVELEAAARSDLGR